VKYSHHPDGRAHFSQTGKIITAVKRQSIPLDAQNGHIFTLHIQGLAAFEPADPVKDATTSLKRAVIEFTMEPPDSVKFVGRWLDVNKIRCSNPVPSIGPIVPTQDPGGAWTNSIFVANPHPNTRHVLAISCIPFHKLGTEPEMLMFYGGFDALQAMTDPTKEGGFLAFIYPVIRSRQHSTKAWQRGLRSEILESPPESPFTPAAYDVLRHDTRSSKRPQFAPVLADNR
jgi:hypothetical protein